MKGLQNEEEYILAPGSSTCTIEDAIFTGKALSG